MKRRLFMAIAVCMILSPMAFGAEGGGGEDAGGDFRPLFNGRNLTGWVPMTDKPEAWGAKDGVLYVEGGEGWLRTDREYKNFVLKLDFRLPPGGNSGVFLRAPLKGNGAYEGLEIQVLDHFHEMYKDIKPWQFCGSVYDLVAAKQEGLKPAGEWNAYEITHDGDHVKVVLNGVTIVDANLEEHRDKIDKHPGLGRKEGYIGLQAHGSKVEYRNVLIKELD